jgi:hypothetical protein
LVVQPICNRLKCQRTTNPVLPSTLEIRPAKFPSAFPITAICTSAGFRTSHQPSTIDHQLFNFSFPCAQLRTNAPRLSPTPCKLCKVCKENRPRARKIRLPLAVRQHPRLNGKVTPSRPHLLCVLCDPCGKTVPLPIHQLSTIPSSPPANRRAPPEPRWGERTREPSPRFIAFRTGLTPIKPSPQLRRPARPAHPHSPHCSHNSHSHPLLKPEAQELKEDLNVGQQAVLHLA